MPMPVGPLSAATLMTGPLSPPEELSWEAEADWEEEPDAPELSEADWELLSDPALQPAKAAVSRRTSSRERSRSVVLFFIFIFIC